ncbi:YMGG-like glycine zipper-containing protein [Sphingomonas hankyongi]|uniref:Glycine zipper domain-containing protein n=1 Tax=Sphingomonas hankyongi TaxID=2908209 RepID=A0ABT0RZG7_9SPHN|nr:YMGG-like glycine zipper-containing protein [Sphingomonas hankyongi]MCL6729003.1 glycine zipper domain-containing protein [Sphingomonas hankyongi]
MTRLLFSAAAATSLALTGCATNPHTDYAVKSTAIGAALGAGAGAIAGSVIPGFGTGAGAAIGAGVGGLIGSVIGTQTYNRDTRGYCYWVDQNGQVHYDYKVRC